MIKRLLIANRGEISCRISATAQRLGIRTIAVYSDADRRSRHVRLADEAVCIGPAQPAQSYLAIDKIIAAARDCRAEAIHPGYGFLSENADFAKACEDAGIVFIGPPSSAIRAMGSKSEAKTAMGAAGVPVAPGYHGADQSFERLRTEAMQMGYPIIVKASAGGGGKGMQIVENLAGLSAAIESAKRIARSAFADDALLIERYFRNPRHVEVQVFADRAGQVAALADRDCSIQRRHQKVIEEAPAPDIPSDVREAMASAAKTVARSIGYVGAGTVEFLYSADKSFYFMEMNTRLQVEHPVTECILDLDLVEWQLRVAAGDSLPAAMLNINPRGAAVEARLYAEDPSAGYLPSVGKISHLRWPSAPGVRVDSGIDAGDEVSPHYDPMLGKLIAWGETRELAVENLRRSLGELEIIGVKTNRAQLLGILGDPGFQGADLGTDFIETRGATLALQDGAGATDDAVLAALWCMRSAATGELWDRADSWRLNADPRRLFTFGDLRIAVVRVSADQYEVRSGAVGRFVRVAQCNAENLCAEVDGRTLKARCLQLGPELHLFCDSRHSIFRMERPEDSLEAPEASNEAELHSPLPALVTEVHVRAGQSVTRGTPLVTLEAMKMEYKVNAPHDGIVKRILFAVGERVEQGAPVIELGQ